MQSARCLLAGTALAVAACSSSSAGPGPVVPEAGTEAGIDAGTDASPDALNGCTAYEDLTDPSAVRVIRWDLTPFLATNPDACIEIKVGQTVKWDGDFSMHPLDTLGGTTPNPILNYDRMTGEVTFTAPGLYGYTCDNHAQMLGAVKVVP